MKGGSFILGIPLSFFLILYLSEREWPPIMGIVIPFATIIGIEYFLRLAEWAMLRMRNLLF